MVSSGGGLDVPAYGLGWLACCAPNMAAVAAKQGVDKNGPLHPDLLSRSKESPCLVRPCWDGKVLRPSPCTRAAGVKPAQYKRSAHWAMAHWWMPAGAAGGKNQS